MTERDAEQRPSAATKRGTGRQDWHTWPAYHAARVGFDGYWYPTVWSRDVTSKPYAVTVLGEYIVLCRDGGVVRALADRCPHRGVPLSYGTRELPGTISCRYHGWTFDLTSGVMCAALTDGPDSKINGKARVLTFPVAERLGLVWVYIGPQDAPIPSIDREVPPELRANDFVLGGKIEPHRGGNWRLAAENGFDEGHAKYLHRNSLYYMFKSMPAWTETHVTPSDEDGWITRVQDARHWAYEDPARGRWSTDRWYRRRTGDRPATDANKIDSVIEQLNLPGRVSIRMPGQLRVAFADWIHYEFYVPEDQAHHRYIQIAVKFGGDLRTRMWLAYYLAYLRPVFHGQFTAQDTWMVNVMDAPPEQLYRPDVSITAWRKLCQASRAPAHRPAASPPWSLNGMEPGDDDK